jgi:hypothetical protein
VTCGCGICDYTEKRGCWVREVSNGNVHIREKATAKVLETVAVSYLEEVPFGGECPKCGEVLTRPC